MKSYLVNIHLPSRIYGSQFVPENNSNVQVLLRGPASSSAGDRLPDCYTGQKLPQLDLNDLRHCLDWWLVVWSDTSGIHILP
jgi:hypothetical protein